MVNRIWHYIVNISSKTWEGWQEDDGFLLSAAMAYYAAFSLFPLCLVLIAILGFVLRLSRHADNAQTVLLEQVRHQAGHQAGPWLADQLQALLAGVRENAGLSGPLGIVTLLAAAIVVFLQLDYMFGRIFGAGKAATVTTWRRYLGSVAYGRLWAFLMLLAVGALLLALFVANIALSGFRTQIESRLPGGIVIWGWTHFLFALVSNALLFGLLYKVLPKTTIRWRDAFAGGLLVSLVWILGQRLLVEFMIGTNYTAYGIVGSFIAVMIWVYYVSAILFLGAEFVEALAIVGGRAMKPPKVEMHVPPK